MHNRALLLVDGKYVFVSSEILDYIYETTLLTPIYEAGAPAGDSASIEINSSDGTVTFHYYENEDSIDDTTINSMCLDLSDEMMIILSFGVEATLKEIKDFRKITIWGL